MSGGPRTLFATALLVSAFAVGGCSAESSSNQAEADGAADPGATSTASDDPGGIAGGSGKDADDNAHTGGEPDEPSDDAAGTGSGDDGSHAPSALRADTSRYLRDAARLLHKGGQKDESLRDTATGTALDAALAQAAEFRDNGWHQIGVPRVVGSQMVRDGRDDDPPRMTISACVDSSAVDVVDASGESVRHGSHPERSRMIYTLVRRDGAWLVERETFPDDPEC